MFKTTCKLCLFKCDPDDDDDLCENIEELRKIVKDIFHSKIDLSFDDHWAVCRPCNEKLHTFYEYYVFVLENQKQQRLLLAEKSPKPDAVFVESKDEIKCEPDICREMQNSEESDVEASFQVKKKKVKKTFRPKKTKNEPLTPSQEEKEDILIQKYFSFNCDQCPEAPSPHFTSYRDFKKHMNERHKVKHRFICCDMEFSTRKTIIRHCQDHENPISCTQCSFIALNKIKFLQHMADAHDVKLKMPVKKHDVALYTCNECGKQLIGKHKIKGHLLQVHFHNVHICETCAVVYKTHNSLQNHIKREHLGIKEPRRQCPQCGNWVQESSLPTHIKNHQVERIKLSCKICNKEFMGKKNLQRHVREKHTERAFKFRCSYCSKSFSQEKKMNEHVATHTGIPLYECEFCAAVFNSCGNFAAHKRKLHPVEYEQQKLMNKLST
ncbi:transcription factor grauzone-like isoform X2 [Culicoides brevitarsis]|uniref:transcription factor grauzone-like isoform X2 n=1 Tax=Culicoides brevitarsis TaxID=469753 RepID=UPI00307C2CCA